MDEQTLRTFADEVKSRLGLKDFRLYLTRNGDIKLDMIAVPKGSFNQGRGTEAMKALTSLADANGKRILLITGTKDEIWGTTSSKRLEKFYRRFGFVSNRGRHKDFTISDSMYREPKMKMTFKEFVCENMDKVWLDHPVYGKETIGQFLKRRKIAVHDGKITLFHGRPKGSSYDTLRAGSYLAEDPNDARHFAGRDRDLSPKQVEVIKLELSPDDIDPGIFIKLNIDYKIQPNAIMEAPLHDYQTIGNFDKGYSFRSKRDRAIIKHPKAIERTRKKFGNTDYDFDFYFVNSKEADSHTELGLVPPEWIKNNLGDEVYNAILPNLDKDHIQVVFTNNKGAEKVPMTAWMMAHRLGHALNRKGGLPNRHGQYVQAANHIASQMSVIMDYYGNSNFPHSDSGMITQGRDNQRTWMYFFQQVCTFKSARDNNVRDWFEILNELIAQYLTTGKMKFNKAPRCFGGGAFGKKIRYCCKEENLEEVNEVLDMLSRDMETMIDDILSSVVNSVLVM